MDGCGANVVKVKPWSDARNEATRPRPILLRSSSEPEILVSEDGGELEGLGATCISNLTSFTEYANELGELRFIMM